MCHFSTCPIAMGLKETAPVASYTWLIVSIPKAVSVLYSIIVKAVSSCSDQIETDFASDCEK